MYIALTSKVIDLLCCPFCKNNLIQAEDVFNCKVCGLGFPGKKVNVGKKDVEKIFDFRLHTPPYCVPETQKLWQEAQEEYIEYHDNLIRSDSLQSYLDEINSVKEIYTEQFHIKGNVLDVGGDQGRLRHFLNDEVDLFVSTDPFIDAFERMDEQPNLIKAYPCLLQPCNFLLAHAEYLPFKPKSFDFIHMRSVVDHFSNPYFAFLEAYRCCKPGGNILVGLLIEEKLAELKHSSYRQNLSLLKNKITLLNRIDPSYLFKTLIRRKFKDDHMNRLTYSQLRDLYEKTGWRIIKEHWQKPPNHYCIYMCGEEKSNYLVSGTDQHQSQR